EVALASEAGQLVLFHHDPSYTDDMVAGMEITAKTLFADSVAAHEGLEIALRQEKKMAMMLQKPSPLSLSHRESG
ncbi:MAG TPA: hypothetical protein VKE92_00780, partial [Anaerolineales bacterium]|nr:hypothetical protein [Anaerolineales bacterium]